MNKYFKLIGLIFITVLTFASCKEQEQKVEKAEKIIAIDILAEKEAVATVMKNYQNAIENLTTEGTKSLFAKESSVFESGGVEGTYENYEAHHLSPELKAFDSFNFSDYKIDIEVDLPYAFVTETYIYTIGLKANKDKGREAKTVEQKGVATSDLKKIEGEWKIIKTHTSARKLSKASH
jgi:hypothetical protein